MSNESSEPKDIKSRIEIIREQQRNPSAGITAIMVSRAEAEAQSVEGEHNWWCCKADYPNHESGCVNAESVVEPELLPCPFCGLSDVEVEPQEPEGHPDHEWWWVHCPHCSVHIDVCRDRIEATGRWNTRSRPTVAAEVGCMPPAALHDTRFCNCGNPDCVERICAWANCAVHNKHRGRSVEAAEICAEMARHEAMLAAKAQSEDSLDTVYYGHKFASDALREAERRIRAAATPSAAEIRRQVWDEAIAIVGAKRDEWQVRKSEEARRSPAQPTVDYLICRDQIIAANEIIALLVAARDAAPAPI